MTSSILHEVIVTEPCEEALSEIARHDRRIAKEILLKIECLAFLPEKQGKALTGELAGLWSRRACGQRYRIIYRINPKSRRVEAIYAGIRKEGSRGDVYASVKRVLRR